MSGYDIILVAVPMIYSYYKRLSAAQQRIYRKSDAIVTVTLPDTGRLQPLIPVLLSALEQDDRKRTEAICHELAFGISVQLQVPLVRVRVLAVRPSASWGELHGLYQPGAGNDHAVITLWMRTAKQKRVVAFRTFLRTLLHELCHHLDYELHRLPDSFHTEGFYKRESSMFNQLVPEAGNTRQGKSTGGQKEGE